MKECMCFINCTIILSFSHSLTLAFSHSLIFHNNRLLYFSLYNLPVLLTVCRNMPVFFIVVYVCYCDDYRCLLHITESRIYGSSKDLH